MPAQQAVVTMPLHQKQELTRWSVVNDTVMGGVSSSRVTAAENGMLFSGILSLHNNGGFASVRRYGDAIYLDDAIPLKLTVIGDGRTYQLRLRTRWNFDRVAYAADFTTEADKVTTFVFFSTDFVPVWRGRLVKGAPDLTFSDVLQPGFMLADKRPGEFELNVISLFQ